MKPAIMLSLTMLAAFCYAGHVRHAKPRFRPSIAVELAKKTPWQSIAAGGAAAGTAIAAYKTGNGIEKGLQAMAEKHPESFKDTLSIISTPFRYAAFIITAIAALLLYNKFKPRKDSP